eukprot:427323-Amphidinium_carterae.2
MLLSVWIRTPDRKCPTVTPQRTSNFGSLNVRLAAITTHTHTVKQEAVISCLRPEQAVARAASICIAQDNDMLSLWPPALQRTLQAWEKA